MPLPSPSLSAPSCLPLLAALILAANGAGAAETGAFIPFVPPRHVPENSLVDLRWLHPEPAGSHGRIRAQGSQLIDDRGPVRFWGINLNSEACIPKTAEEASRDADRLARYGFNLVRLHFVDYYVGPDRGLLLSQEEPHRIHPEGLDRHFRFIAELKKRGIFCIVQVMVCRKYWVDEAGKPFEINFRTAKNKLHEPAYTAVLETYARGLLATRNPHTGMSLADDPAVMLVEIANETGNKNSAWYPQMKQFIHSLGYPGLVAGSHVRFSRKSTQDVEIENEYWNHPGGSPSVNQGTLASGSGRTYCGGAWGGFVSSFSGRLPALLTEYDHAFHNYASSEAPLAIAVAFATTEVDAIIPFAWAHNYDSAPDYNINAFRYQMRPATQAHLCAAAVASLLPAMPGAGLHKAADGKDTTVSAATWARSGPGLVTLRTGRVRTAFGATGGKTIDLGDGYTLRRTGAGRDYCAFSLTSLGDHDLGQPGRMLLSITGEDRNTALGEKGVNDGWGRGPVLTELIPIEVSLPVPASEVTVQALGPDGTSIGPVAVAAQGEGSVLRLAQEGPRSPWYCIEIGR